VSRVTSTRAILYRTYRLNVDLTCRFSTGTVQFDRMRSPQEVVDTEGKLANRLRQMGCEDELGDLRQQRDARLARWEAELEIAHLNPDELF
jgi:hypothetical protein